MSVLIIADTFPAPDRNSADFRFSKLIGMIGEEHEVFFCALGEKRQIEKMGGDQTARYRAALADAGVHVLGAGIGRALREHKYNAVVFEWYYAARPLIDEVRMQQPGARIIVDSVDVVFNRLEAKARVTKADKDIARAAQAKRDELAIYARSDLVITVTDADAEILHRENPRLATFTIPNIHPLQEPVAITADNAKRLIFIGSYARPGGETNIDAMRYFCSEILPLIIRAEPEVKLRIVGGPQTAEISELASDHVEVLGFVPETKPFLETSAISIAPLRFGGGMKGKIGEAMSYALPVVTTSTGTEGFGLEPGKHVLVGNDPQSFADAVVKLLRDREALEQVRMAGYQFIRDHYSDVAVRKRVHALFQDLKRYPIKQMPLTQRGMGWAKQLWQLHVGWRFK
jgi:glycosyltransferase involved in cell wall biosynthesis